VVLDFPASTDVGRLVPAVGEAHDARSGVSGWELWERREREEERRAAELGARDGLPLFLPTPYFAASAEEE